MRSGDIDTLKDLVNAAKEWRALANTVNVSLDILTTRINGEIVQLEWLPDYEQFGIRTADSTFTLRWNKDPDGWYVVSQ